MKEDKIKSSILLSIFKRKGGEGDLTKIITPDNSISFINELKSLDKNEEALICYKKDSSNWLLITNTRILQSRLNTKLSISYNKIHKVHLALQDEFIHGIMNKTDFTYLVLETNNEKYCIEIEKGEPFQGIYQMLHFIVSCTKVD